MRKSLYSLFPGMVVANVLWLIPIAAQEHKGSIAGRVLDMNQGAMIGARLGLPPTVQTAVSEDPGEVSVSELATRT